MQDVRGDFPILRRTIEGKPIVYLDSSATSLKPQPVIDAVTRFYTDYTSNVHRGVHALADEATEQYEGSRRAIARFLNADEHEIVYTRGSTEAINLVCRCCPDLNRVITTAIEHHSNFLPWAYGDQATVVGVDGEGRLDLEAMGKALEVGADLVAVGHVSNALGVVHPVEKIIQMAHDTGALVLLDAAQSVPHFATDVKALDVDFLACSAHKMLGPGGIGALYGKAELLEKMGPWLLGGDIIDQVHVDSYSLLEAPHKFEAGTPAIEAAIGWGEAVAYLSRLGMDEVATHDRTLVEYALERLSGIAHVRVVSPQDPARLCSAVSFQIENLEAHGVARMLSNRGNVLVRSGFHCAQPMHETLDLLPTVRASFYVYNTTEDIDALAEGLEVVVRFL